MIESLSANDIAAFWLTLQLATISTLILIIIGTPLAWWLAHSQRAAKPFIETVIALPLVLPPTVIGFYLLLAFAPGTGLATLWKSVTGSQLAFSFAGLVLGSIVYSLPFVVQPLQNSFERISPLTLKTAASLGAKPLDIFFSVVLPISFKPMVAAAVLAFSHTIGEFGIVLMIGGNIPGETQVLSIALFDHVETLNYTSAHTLAALLLALSFSSLLAIYSLGRKQAPGYYVLTVDIHHRVGEFCLQLHADFPSHKISGIVGPSGSGKSTLLNIISGFTVPQSDNLVVNKAAEWQMPNGHALPIFRRDVAYVTQRPILFEHLTVRDNILYPLSRKKNRTTGRQQADISQSLDQLCLKLGIKELLDRKPSLLSGGERQRIAIARALFSQTELVLLDEPVSALDRSQRNDVLDLIASTVKHNQSTCLIVSHNTTELMRIADYALLIENGKTGGLKSLSDSLLDLSEPFCLTDESGVILEGRVAEINQHDGIASICIDQKTHVYIPADSAKVTQNQTIRLSIVAKDVSIALSKPADSSILNILPVEIIELTPVDTGQQMLKLKIINSNHFLLSRITTRSAIQLDLSRGKTVYAQIKGIAIQIPSY